MKRVFLFTISLLMILTAFPAQALAADASQITVSDETASVGDEIAVTVTIVNNPGIASIGMDIQYDTSVLELLRVEDDINAGTWVDLDDAPDSKTVMWYNTNEYTGSGIITMIFEVKENAALGFTSISMYCDPVFGGIFNETNPDPLDIELVSGGITVTPAHHDCQWDEGVVTVTPRPNAPGTIVYTCTICGNTMEQELTIQIIPGDVDTDGEVDIVDAELIMYHTVGTGLLIEPASSIADVNGDNIIDARDATQILRYVNELNSILPAR